MGGPTVMIDVHPCIQRLPEGVRVVIAHGSEDDIYRRTRVSLEALVHSSGSENNRFLYYAGSSGLLKGSQLSRQGDGHDMNSLLTYDCLPRLIDAAISDDCPEFCMVRSWKQCLSDQRIASESWLGHSLERLRQRWTSKDYRGKNKQTFFSVQRDSEEFRCVSSVFKSAPREPSIYGGCCQAAWENRRILSIERVENGSQEAGGVRAYAESIANALVDQGLGFEPAVHTRWLFHGTDAVEAIVDNPMAGFQPLSCGGHGNSVWGSGTYFARDAKYVADGPFCSTLPNGSRRVLMCLVATGMSCLGDAGQRGVLPFRQGDYRYDSTVDSLANPEIFIVPHPWAAYPAYVINFA